VFTEPLPSNDRIDKHAHRLIGGGGFMKYAVEMGPVINDIYTKFHKDWFKHSKADLEGEIYRHTDSKVIT
jgi:hypothetical protein